MRAVNRSLVLVLAFLFSVVAVPAYASDDSPGLLETVGNTVESLTTPTPEPAATPQTAGPVTQLTSIADSALGNKTSLSGSTLVSTVDEVLTGGAAEPSDPAEAPEEGIESEGSDLTVERAASVTGQDDVVASSPFETVLQLDSFSASSDSTDVETVASEVAHIPGTSTLPDGGSPLTLAWLVLAMGVTGAGALVIRRSRTG